MVLHNVTGLVQNASAMYHTDNGEREVNLTNVYMYCPSKENRMLGDVGDDRVVRGHGLGVVRGHGLGVGA